MRSVSIRIDINSVKWAWSRDHVTSLFHNRLYTVNHKKTWHFIFDHNFG